MLGDPCCSGTQFYTQLYAINAANGSAIWHTDVGPQEADSSPNVVGAVVYVLGGVFSQRLRLLAIHVLQNAACFVIHQ